MSSSEKSPASIRLLPWLGQRLRLAAALRPTELQVTLFWAGFIGMAGALVSVGFRHLTNYVHWLFTLQTSGYVESFTHLSPWQRVATPTLGGLLAGLTLFLGMRWTRRNSTTDYMEAIVLGDGVVSSRSSLVKSLSAMFSIASGASIGREGPLVQLSAMIASLIGRVRRTPTLQLRLLVACGAAAGIASAYNAPIGGALFVAEVVLQSLAMETFGPLVFSSVIATLTVRQFLGEEPLYHIPPVRLDSNWQILPLLPLGLLAGLLAPWFLRLLRWSEHGFAKLPTPVYVRLALGGAVVGSLAIWHPEVCGNGYSLVNQLLRGEWLWQTLLVVMIFKIVATASTFGSGAVGGVFTPTQFVGACLGSLVCDATRTVLPGLALHPEAFVIVGMGAFLAATTHAPIMAILVLLELTGDYQIVLPLMLACVTAHYTCLAFKEESIYASSLRRKGATSFQQQLASLRVVDLMKTDPLALRESADFEEIARAFTSHRFNYLYVTDAEGTFLGAISLHDVKSYLHQRELAAVVQASDIMREQFPTIEPEETLSSALEKFVTHDGERLPVTLAAEPHRLVGSIAKTDLILALAEKNKVTTGPGTSTAPRPD